MQNKWKYMVRAFLAFSPTILFLLTEYTGPKAVREWLEVVGPYIQGLVLMPFFVCMWVDFRRYPEKYPVPGWAIRVLDIVPLGFVVFAIAYYRLYGRQ